VTACRHRQARGFSTQKPLAKAVNCCGATRKCRNARCQSSDFSDRGMRTDTVVPASLFFRTTNAPPSAPTRGTVSFGGVSRLISDGSTATTRLSHRDTPLFLTVPTTGCAVGPTISSWVRLKYGGTRRRKGEPTENTNLNLNRARQSSTLLFSSHCRAIAKSQCGTIPASARHPRLEFARPVARHRKLGVFRVPES
jgi:hypothetical protein